MVRGGAAEAASNQPRLTGNGASAARAETRRSAKPILERCSLPRPSPRVITWSRAEQGPTRLPAGVGGHNHNCPRGHAVGPGGAAAPPRAPTWCSKKKELGIAKRLQGERLHRRQAPPPLCFERRERLNEHFNRNALKTPLAQTSPTRPCAQRAILSAFSVTKLLTSHLFLEPTPIPFNLPTPWCQSGASPRRATGSPPSLPRTRRATAESSRPPSAHGRRRSCSV